MTKKIKSKDLQLRDIIILYPDMPYCCCTVKNIKPIENSEHILITLFRPYIHTSDFSYTSGVICYIGFEEFTIIESDAEYDLVERPSTPIK